MKIHEIAQKELAWYQLRIGKVTASELSELMTPKFELRTGETPKTYLYEKLAEVVTGAPVGGFSTWQTEEGQLREDEARRWAAYALEQPIRNVGFCEHDDGRSGCSPDGLIGEDGGLEIKCPQATNHVRYLMDGVLPPAYACQVHMSLYVTGRAWWRFISYRRKFPPLVLTVQRDPVICGKIAQAIGEFHEKFNTALSRMREME